MFYVLKGFHPVDGEMCNEFTCNERETAVHVGRVWYQRGWNPSLYVKSYDGRFVWLTSLLAGQRLAA